MREKFVAAIYRLKLALISVFPQKLRNVALYKMQLRNRERRLLDLVAKNGADLKIGDVVKGENGGIEKFCVYIQKDGSEKFDENFLQSFEKEVLSDGTLAQFPQVQRFLDDTTAQARRDLAKKFGAV